MLFRSRFITFLLLVSARVKTKSLENVLLLIDEPEISLHPAGIRNLRDELLSISKQNLVVYATHSPYMIDRKSIERHSVIEKKGDITSGVFANAGKVFDEEVLLNSLGVSVFESLKKKNIIFEGWRDKRLFDIFVEENKGNPEYKSLIEAGACFVSGVKDVRNVVPILALANTSILVVSDHDQPAIEAKKDFNISKFEGDWLTYRDLVGGASNVVTVEDFVRPEFLRGAFNIVAKRKGISDLELSFDGVDRISNLEKRLQTVLDGKQEVKGFLNEWKTAIFESVECIHIEHSYADAMKELAKLVAGT